MSALNIWSPQRLTMELMQCWRIDRLIRKVELMRSQRRSIDIMVKITREANERRGDWPRFQGQWYHGIEFVEWEGFIFVICFREYLARSQWGFKSTFLIKSICSSFIGVLDEPHHRNLSRWCSELFVLWLRLLIINESSDVSFTVWLWACVDYSLRPRGCKPQYWVGNELTVSCIMRDDH
jgi:hypothetical protein